MEEFQNFHFSQLFVHCIVFTVVFVKHLVKISTIDAVSCGCLMSSDHYRARDALSLGWCIASVCVAAVFLGPVGGALMQCFKANAGEPSGSESRERDREREGLREEEGEREDIAAGMDAFPKKTPTNPLKRKLPQSLRDVI